MIFLRGVFSHVAGDHTFRNKKYFYHFTKSVGTTVEEKSVQRFKLLLVGPKGAGKSSIYNSLQVSRIRKSISRSVAQSKEGISIYPWFCNYSNEKGVEEDVVFHLWDLQTSQNVCFVPSFSLSHA